MPGLNDTNKNAWHLTQTGAEQQASATQNQNVVQLRPQGAPTLPDGFSYLTDFLDKFDEAPEISAALPGARIALAEASPELRGARTLRDLRLSKGWSQAEFAQMLGTSQARISRLEARKEKPAEDTLRDLASLLAVDFNTLMDALKYADNK